MMKAFREAAFRSGINADNREEVREFFAAFRRLAAPEAVRPTTASLIKAIERGDDEALKRLLKGNPCLSLPLFTRTDRFALKDSAPVQYASLSRTVERNLRKYLRGQMDVAGLAEALINLGRPGWPSHEGRTPLTAAAVLNSDRCLALLCNHAKYREFDAPDGMGVTPLTAACELGHLSSLEVLIACHADVNGKDRLGRTPLNCAIKSPQAEKCVKLLLDAQADFNQEDGRGEQPLSVAVTCERRDVIRLLAVYGCTFEFGQSQQTYKRVFSRVPVRQDRFDEDIFDLLLEMVNSSLREYDDVLEYKNNLLQALFQFGERALSIADFEAHKTITKFYNSEMIDIVHAVSLRTLAKVAYLIPDHLSGFFQTRALEIIGPGVQSFDQKIVQAIVAVESRSKTFRLGCAHLRCLFWSSVLNAETPGQIYRLGIAVRNLEEYMFAATSFDIRAIIRNSAKTDSASIAAHFCRIYTNLRRLTDRREFNLGQDDIVLAAYAAVNTFLEGISDVIVTEIRENLKEKRFQSLLHWRPGPPWFGRRR